MNQNSNDPLDALIDEGARQLVSRDAPEQLRAAVLSRIDLSRNRRRVVQSVWGMALAASVAVVLIMILLWKTESPIKRVPATTPQTAAVSGEPSADVPRRTVEATATVMPAPSTGGTTPTASVRQASASVVLESSPETSESTLNPITINQIESPAIALGSVDVRPIALASLKVDQIDSQP